MVGHVVEDGSQCLVARRSDVSEGRGAGQQVPTPCRVGGMAPGTLRAASDGQEVTAEVLSEDGQMRQHTCPAKVMARIEVEVRLIGAISTGDVVMETLLKAVGEPTAASLRSASCACSMAAVHSRSQCEFSIVLYSIRSCKTFECCQPKNSMNSWEE
jgi:hypothetical protein